MIAFGSQEGNGPRILALRCGVSSFKTRLLVGQRSEADDHDLALDDLGPCSESARVVAIGGYETPTLVLIGRVDGCVAAVAA